MSFQKSGFPKVTWISLLISKCFFSRLSHHLKTFWISNFYILYKIRLGLSDFYNLIYNCIKSSFEFLFLPYSTLLKSNFIKSVCVWKLGFCKNAINNMYIACVSFVINPKVSVYLLSDFLAGNPVADYVARLHTWNVVRHFSKNS